MNEVCRELRRWLDEGIQPCRVWINVSPRQLMDVRTAVTAAVDRFDLRPEMLGIEITERTFVDDPVRAGRTLSEIRDQGFSVAIDDFGVGCSSLGALKDYPLDKLTIDASFVRGLSRVGQDSEIVRAIVTLARSLGLAVVAEGVETQKQLQVLRARNVDTVQGNVVSGPLSGADASVYLVNPVSAGIMEAGAG
ncbi:MAG: EAL domain-containing protein (putative c-di-GMP-specific phosphodiesterase class I) [Gammaproteobacteria bacterium]|jgi:EAL domain-containing protein (putative c-di-GMP-specific phosphodiesterase class I)